MTIGGWIVTYVIDVRHGGPSAGYISSGFFGGTFQFTFFLKITKASLSILLPGLTFGRVALLWVNKLVNSHPRNLIFTSLTVITGW